MEVRLKPPAKRAFTEIILRIFVLNVVCWCLDSLASYQCKML